MGIVASKVQVVFIYWIHVTNINDLNEVEKETVYHHLNPDIGPFAET